jgi:hypothetical protein
MLLDASRPQRLTRAIWMQPVAHQERGRVVRSINERLRHVHQAVAFGCGKVDDGLGSEHPVDVARVRRCCCVLRNADHSVNGQSELPVGGQQNCPLVAMRTARSWPTDLPTWGLVALAMKSSWVNRL